MISVGLLFGPLPSLDLSSEFILRWLYLTPEPTEPVNALKPTKTERNTRIRELHAAGYTLEQLAEEYGISKARVWEIVQRR